MKLVLSDFRKSNFTEVARIYQEGIDTGIATFETQAPNFSEWDLRFFKECRLVASLNNKVVGWAALSLVSKRKVYCGVAEVSVYVSSTEQGKQVGSQLLSKLIEVSEQKGFWTLTAHIFPQNLASIQLHKKYGFRIVGIHEKIAKLNGVWQDNTLLERRSPKIH